MSTDNTSSSFEATWVSSKTMAELIASIEFHLHFLSSFVFAKPVPSLFNE
jgi:hypothetical protein